MSLKTSSSNLRRRRQQLQEKSRQTSPVIRSRSFTSTCRTTYRFSEAMSTKEIAQDGSPVASKANQGRMVRLKTLLHPARQLKSSKEAPQDGFHGAADATERMTISKTALMHLSSQLKSMMSRTTSLTRVHRSSSETRLKATPKRRSKPKASKELKSLLTKICSDDVGSKRTLVTSSSSRPPGSSGSSTCQSTSTGCPSWSSSSTGSSQCSSPTPMRKVMPTQKMLAG